MIAECVGLPMSLYYQKFREMQEILPVRTSYDAYIDKKRNVGEYNKDSPYYKELTEYYYMEYNSIVGGKDYRKDLVEPYSLRKENSCHYLPIVTA